MRSKPLIEDRHEPLLRPDAPFAFGVEEEFFLTDAVTGVVAATMPVDFMKRCKARYGTLVSTELLQGQIEIVTPVCHTVVEARDSLSELRESINREAAAVGLALLAAGTHPRAEWRDQHAAELPRYREMMNEFRLVAQRNLLCGLHVHVAVPAEVDRIRVMNRVMPWIPMLLALSTSSPFWNGTPTGLMSYRQSAYDEWPRSGIPDHFDDEAEYGGYVQRLVDAGAIEDARSIWWAVRPSPRYPTLEFRIADACTALDDSLCIAQLARCLVRAAVLFDGTDWPWDASRRLLIEENRWRAKRYGLDARFLPADDPTPRPVRVLLEELLDFVAPHAHALGCVTEVMHAREIARRGTSADAQLRVYNAAAADGADSREAIQAVVRDLMVRTAAAATSWPRAA